MYFNFKMEDFTCNNGVINHFQNPRLPDINCMMSFLMQMLMLKDNVEEYEAYFENDCSV